MFLSFFKSRPALTIMLAVALAANWLHAAPYGPDGLPIEWTQPDGSKLSLRVFGDEFYVRTETLDGYTVVFDAAKNAYFYAELPTPRQSLFQPWVVSMCSLSIVLSQPNPIRK